MKFEENLVKLRKSKGLSQEELAEKLDVSRQTVYKWESGQSYPELDRLVIISKLFGYTIDDILHKDLAIGANNIKAEYNRFYNRFSIFIALGVFIIINAVVALLALFGYFGEDEYLVPLSVFFGLIAVGVGILIAFGIQSDHFKKSIPQNAQFYTEKEHKIFLKKYTFGIVFGIGFIVLAIPVLLISMAYLNDFYAVALMLFTVAVGVFLLICFGCLESKYKMEYQAQKTEQPPQKHERNEIMEKAAPVIMISATIIFLVLGLVFHLWHPGWVVYLVAVLACGIVAVATRKDND